MEMASSEVDISSCQTFNCVLNRPHERCTRGDNNNNNVRNIHVVYEKNHNVLVRDHLDDECSFNKSSVSDSLHDVPSSSSSGSDQNHVLGQPENPSRKETMAASSLVQIWEARTTQQPPSLNQNQSLIDSRTSSIGSNALENSDSLNEESVKESELIQPIEEETNEEEEKEEEMECDPSQDYVEKEREGVKVMDIVRKLSSDSGPMPSSSNDNTKEVQATEARCFPQLACSPRIRGRQAWADLVVQMARDREKELAVLLERHSVSKFTHRGRIQSTLRIRCYERCRAIQDRHRCISSSGGSDLSRSPLGSGGMHFLWGRTVEKDLQKGTEKKVMQEKTEKSGLKETQEVISAVVKKAVLSETAENKTGFRKSVGGTIQKETTEGRGEKRETKEKAETKESSNGRGEKRETKEKAVLNEIAENKNSLRKSIGEIQKETTGGRGEKQETKEKVEAKDSSNGRGESRETKEKAEAKERPNGRGEKGETKEKAEAKESSNGRGEKRESTKEKPIAKESVEGKPLVGIAEKVNLWNSEEKMNKRKGFEKSKADTERVEKNVLEEATKRILNVESAERSSTTTSRGTMMPLCVFSEKVVIRKEKEDCVFVESKSKETKDRNNKPQEVIRQEDSCSGKPASEETVLQETTMKCDLKKPIEKEVREERGEKREMEGSVEGNTLMGIAEKVNMWNSAEKKNRKRAMEKGKGKTVNKANTETNEVLQEATRRISNVETAERSIATSSEKVDNKEVMDRRESKPFETAEKGRRKKEEIFASVETNSKEILEDKNMNSKPSVEDGEAVSILHKSEGKSAKEIDVNNPQEVTQEKECVSEGSKERSKEKNYSLPDVQNGFKEPEDEEIKKLECEEEGEEEAKEVAETFVNDWDENAMVEEEEEYEDYDLYMGEYMDDWIHNISRPRSYWEDLRKERYLEVLNTESGKKDICNLIESRTVSNFLASDLRKKIDNLMISRVQSHIGIPINQLVAEEEGEEEDSLMITHVQSHIGIPINQVVAEEDGEKVEEEEEEWEVECSARNQEDNETEEEEPEKTILEAESDISQSPGTMITWTFTDQYSDKDQEPTTSSSLPEPSVPTNQSEMQIISDLQSQVEQLQRQVLELQLSVKSCIDMQLQFQNSITQDPSRSGSTSEQRVDTSKNPLKRKCCVCSEMPVDSLLYRCGHMCTCLKCAHELQWSSKKCPICMAPIVDVVRAFLDS